MIAVQPTTMIAVQPTTQAVITSAGYASLQPELVETEPNLDVPMTQPYRIPDIFDGWRWKTSRNPHYEEAKAESLAWFRSFEDFYKENQDSIEGCDGMLFVAWGLPVTDKQRLRCCGDVNTLLFVVDDILDYESDEVVKDRMRIILSALKNPHTPRPPGEWVVGEMTRQFWERTIEIASPLCQKRFVSGVKDCMVAMALESDARKTSSAHSSINSFLKTRRDSAGCALVFALMELEIALPDEAFYHPYVRDLIVIIQDISVMANDVFSYRREQARGRTEDNIITVVMDIYDLDVNGAIDWVEKRHKELEKEFIEKYDKVPKFGEPVDLQVAKYIEGLANWVWANARWSFECGRYFGGEGLEIMEKTKWVGPVPKLRV